MPSGLISQNDVIKERLNTANSLVQSSIAQLAAGDTNFALLLANNAAEVLSVAGGEISTIEDYIRTHAPEKLSSVSAAREQFGLIQSRITDIRSSIAKYDVSSAWSFFNQIQNAQDKLLNILEDIAKAGIGLVSGAGEVIKEAAQVPAQVTKGLSLAIIIVLIILALGIARGTAGVKLP